MEVKRHNKIDKQPPAEAHEHRRTCQDVDQHGGHQQWQQRPLVVVIGHVTCRPGSKEVLTQPNHLLSKRVLKIRSGISAPPAIRAIGNNERAALCQYPRYYHRNRRGHDETRGAAESTFTNSSKSAQYITVTLQFDRLQSADVASQERENGNTNTALPGNAEHGQLQEPGRRILRIARSEEIIIPRSSKVSENDKERSDTSKALWFYFYMSVPAR